MNQTLLIKLKVFYDRKSKKIFMAQQQKKKEELLEEGIDLVSIPWVEKIINFLH